MLSKVVGPFFYFCYHVETEDIKAKPQKSGRISLVVYIINYS